MHSLTLYFEKEEQLTSFVNLLRELDMDIDLKSVQGIGESDKQEIDWASLFSQGYIKV